MKLKIITVLMATVLPLCIYAQPLDKIVLLNGKTLKCKVTEISQSTVKYSYPSESLVNSEKMLMVAHIELASGRIVEGEMSSNPYGSYDRYGYREYKRIMGDIESINSGTFQDRVNYVSSEIEDYASIANACPFSAKDDKEEFTEAAGKLNAEFAKVCRRYKFTPSGDIKTGGGEGIKAMNTRSVHRRLASPEIGAKYMQRTEQAGGSAFEIYAACVFNIGNRFHLGGGLGFGMANPATEWVNDDIGWIHERTISMPAFVKAKFDFKGENHRPFIAAAATGRFAISERGINGDEDFNPMPFSFNIAFGYEWHVGNHWIGLEVGGEPMFGKYVNTGWSNSTYENTAWLDLSFAFHFTF